MSALIAVVFTAGGLLTLLMAYAFWKLHTKWGKTLVQIFWFFFILVAFLWLVSPWIINGFFAAVVRNQQAWDHGVAQVEASGPDPFITNQDYEKAKGFAQDILNFGDGSGGGNTSPSSTPVPGGGNQSVPDTATTTTVLKADAIRIWFTHIDTMPGGWLSGASKKLLPMNISCDWKGGEGLTTGKVDERYDLHCYSTDPATILDAYDIQANGFFMRDSRSWAVSPGSGTIKGMGDWSKCGDCWTTVSSNALPQPTQDQPQPTQDQPQPTPQASDQKVTVTDQSGGGAWGYVPNNGSCQGVSQTHVTTIPFGTTVKIVQTFAGAGWTTYLGSKDLILVEWAGEQYCIFAGTVK